MLVCNICSYAVLVGWLMIDQFSEIDEVVKVQYVTRDSERYRIEALRSEDGSFSTKVFRQLAVHLQPSEIRNGQDVPAEEFLTWVEFHGVPWSRANSAEEAIRLLLSNWS